MAKSKKIEALKYTGNFTMIDGDLRIKVDYKRFYDQFKRAQRQLDFDIMNDMVPYMPMDTGNFINLTRQESTALAGSGEVVAGHAPYGRFLYYGKLMIDPMTGSSRAPWLGTKVVKVPEVELAFSNPKAVPMWFEEAKKHYAADWIRKAKKTAGGGD